MTLNLTAALTVLMRAFPANEGAIFYRLIDGVFGQLRPAPGLLALAALVSSFVLFCGLCLFVLASVNADFVPIVCCVFTHVGADFVALFKVTLAVIRGKARPTPGLVSVCTPPPLIELGERFFRPAFDTLFIFHDRVFLAQGESNA